MFREKEQDWVVPAKVLKYFMRTNWLQELPS